MSPRAEWVAPAQLAGVAAAWRDLCARAAEPNPFAEPDFLLPLLAYERPRGLAVALIWEDARLIALAALQPPPLGLGLTRVWRSAYAPLPALALDADALPAALAALADLCRGGLLLPRVARAGPLAQALAALAAAGRLGLESGLTTERAALRNQGAAAFEAGLDRARRRRWARLARQLGQRGALGAVDGPDAIEAFFALERKGWKGARGTALADDPARLAFARAALGGFAQAARLDAHALTLDGEPIAAGLMFLAGDRAFYWKNAYDETYAHHSPGVQLTLSHTRRLAERPGVALMDSCADEGNPMIGRVWGDRLTFDDMALSTEGRFGWRWAAERARAALRRQVKSALARLRR